MKIIVTGGAGFIGSVMVQYLVRNYPEDMIINLDKLTYAGNLENLRSVENEKNYRFIKGDIADRDFIFRLFEEEKPDVVINFAAESNVDRSVEHPEEFVRTNVTGTTTRQRTLSSGVYGRGIWRSAVGQAGSVLYGDHAPSCLQPIFCGKGFGRHVCNGLSQNLFTAGDHFQMLKQLRSVSVPGKAHPAYDQQGTE